MPQRLWTELDDGTFALIVFDKGGTLIDFHGMWSDWLVRLARRLEQATALALADRLYDAMGFDAERRQVDPLGQLATAPRASLPPLVRAVLEQCGLSAREAAEAQRAVWFMPDPVADSHPLTDLHALFDGLRRRGHKIAIATMDDRAPTQAALAHLGVAGRVDALVCADDGLPPKPAPDMVWAACRAVGVEPAQAVVVGDSVTDLAMGRAAGAGRVVGIATGVTPMTTLTEQADVVLTAVGQLIRGAGNE